MILGLIICLGLIVLAMWVIWKFIGYSYGFED